MPGTFSPPRLERKPIISGPGVHNDTCVTHLPWCISESPTCGGGENVPGISCACTSCTVSLHHVRCVIIFYNLKWYNTLINATLIKLQIYLRSPCLKSQLVLYFNGKYSRESFHLYLWLALYWYQYYILLLMSLTAKCPANAKPVVKLDSRVFTRLQN